MEIKKHLYHIAEKHFALEQGLSRDVKNWDSVEAEVPQSDWNLMAINAYLSPIVRQLIATLPDIFEGSDTLVQLACQIIKAYHYRRRFASKQSGALSSKNGNFVMTVTVVSKIHLILDLELTAFLAANQSRFGKRSRTRSGEESERKRYHTRCRCQT